MSKLSVAVVQQACVIDPDHNRRQSAELVRGAARRGARLVLLQELHTTPYFCQHEDPAVFDLAEPIPGPSTAFFSALAQELDIVLVTSLFERRLEGLFHNTAVVFERDGRIAGRYRKMHIPDDPGFYEKFYFTPGDLGFEPITTSLGRLGVLVCWDQWFPEAARLMALAGADLLLYPTAIGWDPRDGEAERARQREAWVTIQRAHAIANHLPVLVANRTGHEADPTAATAGIQFWGHSFIAGQQGELLAVADADAEGPLIAELELNRTARQRRVWPFLRDRRTDAYGDLTRLARD
ncbi:MAG: carbon-nitrogen hydrolase [Thiotrichales bacterium]